MGRQKTKSSVLAVDPFDISLRPAPMQITWAKWFVEITQNLPGKYHIRRVHYQTLGKLKPDGTQYENTTNDAALLSKASEYARYMGLVDFDTIEDHKNEGVIVQTVYTPDNVSTDFRIQSRPYTESTIDNLKNVIAISHWDIHNSISYDIQSRQPYHIEIWVEKSTMNDVLIPIANKYGATLVVASGQFSITNVKDQFYRIKDLDKPVRIFYLRDFDPAGETMAKAVSRKLEWFVRTRKQDVDVKLLDVALTHKQCVKFQLPRTPMDSKCDKYKNGFQDKYGDGATELDSLEALYPEELANILINAIHPYFDDALRSEIIDFENNEIERYHKYIYELIDAVIDSCRDDLSHLVEKYNEHIASANEIGEQIEELIDSFASTESYEVLYPDKSNRIVRDKDNPAFLLDTTRPYEMQLQRYYNGAEP